MPSAFCEFQRKVSSLALICTSMASQHTRSMPYILRPLLRAHLHSLSVHLMRIRLPVDSLYICAHVSAEQVEHTGGTAQSGGHPTLNPASPLSLLHSGQRTA